MKDQVENLQKRGIPAIAIYSGMNTREIEIAYDNACNDPQVKLLYLSPERLATDMFRLRFARMKISLIAVDEAHCISQWGYDFRPPYLRIAEIRQIKPDVPVLALTATATPLVVKDIKQKLEFRNGLCIQKSFERLNLAYFVKKEEDKMRRLLAIARKNPGSGIVYVRNRKKTKEISEFLIRNNIAAAFYHAGMEQSARDQAQSDWKKGVKRVIVSTNAFGMGIDKPDVRFVVHLDLPDSLEAYFQEAGRAGRDEQKAFAVMLWENADIIDSFKNFEITFPDTAVIKNTYNSLCNYFRLPLGSGRDTSFPFNISEFSDHYNMNPSVVYSSIRFLVKEGLLSLSESLYQPSKIHVVTDKAGLYRFQIENPKIDPFIKLLLRMYSGLFTEFTRISEEEIARKASSTSDKVTAMLQHLQKCGIILYQQRSGLPILTFASERIDAAHITLAREHYKMLKEESMKRLDAIVEYVSGNTRCRSQYLLEYFGEKNGKRCGICDVCLNRNKLELTELEFDRIVEIIKPVLKNQAMDIRQICNISTGLSEEMVVKVIRWLADNDKIEIRSDGTYKWY